MAKPKSTYSCTECGGQTLKWQGQCPHCQAWNTLVEAIAEKAVTRFTPVRETGQVQSLSEVKTGEEQRYSTGIGEFDRVLGGGLVQGGVVLIGGDPGIGKSTLLLQALAICRNIAPRAMSCMSAARSRRSRSRCAHKRLALDAQGDASAGRNPAGENPGSTGANASRTSR